MLSLRVSSKHDVIIEHRETGEQITVSFPFNLNLSVLFDSPKEHFLIYRKKRDAPCPTRSQTRKARREARSWGRFLNKPESANDSNPADAA